MEVWLNPTKFHQKILIDSEVMAITGTPLRLQLIASVSHLEDKASKRVKFMKKDDWLPFLELVQNNITLHIGSN